MRRTALVGVDRRPLALLVVAGRYATQCPPLRRGSAGQRIASCGQSWWRLRTLRSWIGHRLEGLMMSEIVGRTRYNG